MRARVYYDGSMWYGEVYAIWTSPLFGTSKRYWKDVTTGCFTKLGAIIELKLWLRKNKAYEIDVV